MVHTGVKDAIKDKASSIRKWKLCPREQIKKEQRDWEEKCKLTIRDVEFIATRYGKCH